MLDSYQLSHLCKTAMERVYGLKMNGIKDKGLKLTGIRDEGQQLNHRKSRGTKVGLNSLFFLISLLLVLCLGALGTFHILVSYVT